MIIDDIDEIEWVIDARQIDAQLAKLDHCHKLDQEPYNNHNTDTTVVHAPGDDGTWQKVVTDFVREDIWTAPGEVKSCESSKGYDETGRVKLPHFPWSWQDFLPSYLLRCFTEYIWTLPSLLEYIPEVSERHSLVEGALWFNFVFDWWFTEPLHPVDDPEPADESTYPNSCSNCDRRFQQEWELSRHYIDTHLLTSSAPKPAPRIPSPSPSTRESSVEIYLEPESESSDEEFYDELDFLLETITWRWEDFLPDWDKEYLPSPHVIHYNTLEIYDPDPEPRPRRIPTPVEEPVVKKFVLRVPAPVLKQTKYFCKTCSLTICNLCFTKKCSAHNVDWMGQAKFACGAC